MDEALRRLKETRRGLRSVANSERFLSHFLKPVRDLLLRIDRDLDMIQVELEHAIATRDGTLPTPKDKT